MDVSGCRVAVRGYRSVAVRGCRLAEVAASAVITAASFAVTAKRRSADKKKARKQKKRSAQRRFRAHDRQSDTSGEISSGTRSPGHQERQVERFCTPCQRVFWTPLVGGEPRFCAYCGRSWRLVRSKSDASENPPGEAAKEELEA